jgi:hypothetical protein
VQLLQLKRFGWDCFASISNQKIQEKSLFQTVRAIEASPSCCGIIVFRS